MAQCICYVSFGADSAGRQFAPPKGGRPRINERAALTGILFVFRTGIPWEYFQRELGCGSGMTCWRRLHDWMQAGVWQRVHEAVLRRLHEHDQILGGEPALTPLACPRLSGVNMPGEIRLIGANSAATSRRRRLALTAFSCLYLRLGWLRRFRDYASTMSVEPIIAKPSFH